MMCKLLFLAIVHIRFHSWFLADSVMGRVSGKLLIYVGWGGLICNEWWRRFGWVYDEYQVGRCGCVSVLSDLGM
jgi:hypothetical protein